MSFKLSRLADLQAVVTKIKELFVAKEAGKGLSTNDLSNELKANYDTAYTHSQSAHAPSGAQANVIETVKVNGVDLSIANKSVDVAIPTKVSDLTNDSGFINAHPTITTHADETTTDAPNAGETFTVVDSVTRDANGHVTKINTKTVTMLDGYTKGEVDTKLDGFIAASDAMVFKGTLGSGGTVTALPATHKVGDTYKVIAAGTYAGHACEIGDMVICIASGTTANDADWAAVQSNIDGAVVGPATSTNDAIALFSGTSGKLIANSSKTIVAAVTGSANIPTDSAVKTYVEGKGYLTADDFEEITQAEIDALFV